MLKQGKKIFIEKKVQRLASKSNLLADTKERQFWDTFVCELSWLNTYLIILLDIHRGLLALAFEKQTKMYVK